MFKKLISPLLAALACLLIHSCSGSHKSELVLGPEFEVLGEELGEDDLPRRVRHTATGMVFLLVESGSLTMGSPKTEAQADGDEVQYEAEVEQPFYLAETEVTVGQWKTVMGATPHDNFVDDDEVPMSGISWHMASEFIERLNQEFGGGVRLPREVEWEYACRAGTTTPFSIGENITPEQANYYGRHPYADGERGLDRNRPIAVRSFEPNPWGFYDMHGNVWEWCEDLYVVHPEQGELPDLEDLGAPRVMKGGAFTSRGKQLRSAYRDGYPPNSSGSKYGFRLAK